VDWHFGLQGLLWLGAVVAFWIWFGLRIARGTRPLSIWTWIAALLVTLLTFVIVWNLVALATFAQP
jgi:hypothetical protein